MLQKNLLSGITIFILMIATGWYGFNLDTWGKNKVIQNDVISYYAYLPAALIFHDLTFDFTKELPSGFEGTIWLQTAPNGKPILRMTMGLSILWLPFFLVAHLFAHLSGISTLGYSWPYGFSIYLAALFYLFTGLWFLRKMLNRYFPDVITSAVLIIMVTGTNLMYYVISEPGMSHVYNFSLIILFLYFTIRWTEKSNLINSVILGALAGIIVLIRPVNIIVLLFPALTGVRNIRDFVNRLHTNLHWIILAGFTAFLVVLPQLLYWQMQTGHFIFNSYMDQGRFYFLNPQIINGLFSFRKGWLIYTPVMIFAVTGFFMMRKKVTELYFPSVVFAILNIYLIYSWWCWWYGGSFGSRPVIDMYGIMAFPMASALFKILNGKKAFKAIFIVILLGLIWLNQFQMSQYRTSLLHWDSMTKEAYWNIFGKKNWPENYDKLIQVPNYNKALNGEKEYPLP